MNSHATYPLPVNLPPAASNNPHYDVPEPGAPLLLVLSVFWSILRRARK